MKFKYQEYIAQLSIQCPPSDYEPKEMQAFRFVFEANQELAKNNFLPILMINPRRKLSPDTPAARCQGYALSLFDTKQNAEKRYSQLREINRNITKTLGTHLAEGFIDKTDGLVSQIDSKGHLSLHEFENADLATKFQIVSCLAGG